MSSAPTWRCASSLWESERGETVAGRRIGRDLLIILGAVVAMSVGATVLVEGVRHLAHGDDSQGRFSLTLVGFATAFELVVLAWSAARRGATEAVVAAVVGSFAYNATMTLGAAALARPLQVVSASQLHFPAVFMVAGLLVAIGLSSLGRSLGSIRGLLMLLGYAAFVIVVITSG